MCLVIFKKLPNHHQPCCWSKINFKFGVECIVWSFQVCLQMWGGQCDIYCISEFDLFFSKFFHLDLRAHDYDHHDFSFWFWHIDDFVVWYHFVLKRLVPLQFHSRQFLHEHTYSSTIEITYCLEIQKFVCKNSKSLAMALNVELFCNFWDLNHV